jgi:hypothetical protein
MLCAGGLANQFAACTQPRRARAHAWRHTQEAHPRSSPPLISSLRGQRAWVDRGAAQGAWHLLSRLAASTSTLRLRCADTTVQHMQRAQRGHTGIAPSHSTPPRIYAPHLVVPAALGPLCSSFMLGQSARVGGCGRVWARPTAGAARDGGSSQRHSSRGSSSSAVAVAVAAAPQHRLQPQQQLGGSGGSRAHISCHREACLSSIGAAQTESSACPRELELSSLRAVESSD